MRDQNVFGFIAGLTVLACASFLIRQPTRAPAAATQNGDITHPRLAELSRKFTWRSVASSNYVSYLQNLREAGCPDERLRELVLADADEFFAAKRLQEAIAHDEEWWRAEPQAVIRDLLREKVQALSMERGRILEILLGTNAPAFQAAIDYCKVVALTGPVLGALSEEVRARVDEIYGQSLERCELAAAGQDAQLYGRPEAHRYNPVEAARRREETRKELRAILSTEQVEEFLIRYSYNAGRLRGEFRALALTPDEFRKLFRVLDPIDHQMQLEYGSAAALSEKQKARYVAQRDEAVSKALSPQRFQAYLAARNATSTGIAATVP